METKDASLEELQRILSQLNVVHPDQKEASSYILEYLHQALYIFRYLFRNGYTDEQPSHVINYCIMKLGYAKKQIENEDVEEGLKFTKSVIVFYLKEITIERELDELDLV